MPPSGRKTKPTPNTPTEISRLRKAVLAGKKALPM
jgi:hypothetical protein